MVMKLRSRLERIEKGMKITKDELYIRIGKPCFTLHGDEARAHIENGAARFLAPAVDGGFKLYRRRSEGLPCC